MAYDTEQILQDVNGKPIPQGFNQLENAYAPLGNIGYSDLYTRGRVWQVGAGATTTSIPMQTMRGLSLALSAASQSQLVGSTFEIILGTTLAKAIVTAVSSTGVLTLDSALASAPTQGQSFLLTTPDQSSLTGSNAVLLEDPSNGNKANVGQFGSVDTNGYTSEQLAVASFGLMYNDGTQSYERVRNNTQGTLLASAARAAGTASPTMTNYNSRGVIVTLNVTAASGTGGLLLNVRGFDPVSGAWYRLTPDPSSVIAIGLYTYICYPGNPSSFSGGPSGATSNPLPRIWYVNVYASDSSSYTYSIGYALIN